jgi:hypothetical protein
MSSNRSEFDAAVAKLSIAETTSVRRKGTVRPDELARHWKIVDTARRTIDRTTQMGVHDFTNTTAGQRLRNTNQQLKNCRLSAKVYTDTMFAHHTSLQGNTMAQIYATVFGWVKAYPMVKKADAHLTLDLLHHQDGVFHEIVPDDAKELTKKDFQNKAQKAIANIHPTETYTPNQNKAEAAI